MIRKKITRHVKVGIVLEYIAGKMFNKIEQFQENVLKNLFARPGYFVHSYEDRSHLLSRKNFRENIDIKKKLTKFNPFWIVELTLFQQN